MSLLRDYIRHSPSNEEGIKEYVAHVTTRYTPSACQGGETMVKCRWFIEYESKTDMVSTVAALPLAFFGHFRFARSKLPFETYHLLTKQEAKHLLWTNRLRKTFLPFATFGVMASGFVLFFLVGAFLVVVIPLILKGTPRTGESHPAVLIATLFILGFIFVGSLQAKLYLRKAGRPPRTEDFVDQDIKLDSVSFD